jgi:hypothetical protein
MNCVYCLGQKTGMQPFSMAYGENTTYDLYYKWGVIMTRAGEATFTYQPDQSIANATSRYQMLFKSTKFYDNFFKMRDTLSTYYDKNNTLIYSAKHSDEGNYYSIDLMTFTQDGHNTSIHSVRYTPSRKRIDTVLVAAGEVADLLGAVYCLRGINRKMLKPGDVFPLTVAIGKDLVKIKYIYQNQAVIERNNMKYNTHYFLIDIIDEAFESTKTSAEVWVGDDDNFLPIKVRSKLKLGYVEVYHKSSTSLAHPLACCIPIKK